MAAEQVLKLEGERDSAVEEGAAAQSAAREESERLIIELAEARQDNNALQARVEGLCEALDRSRGTGQADAAGRADLDHQVNIAADPPPDAHPYFSLSLGYARIAV